MLRLSAPLLISTLGASPANAQCEIDRPAFPGNLSIGPSASLQRDTAALSSWGREVGYFVRDPEAGWVHAATWDYPDFMLFQPLEVDHDGDLVAVGAQEWGGSAQGAVYVLDRAQALQSTALLVPVDGEGLDACGAGVAIQGSTLVVGATMSVMDVSCGPGKGYIWERAGDAWSLTCRFEPHSYTSTLCMYGDAVAIDGDVAVIGAWMDDGSGVSVSGALYVYERGVAGWSEAAKLYASAPVEYDALGFSVAVEGDTILAGAPGYYVSQTPGAVHVFTRDAAGWSETQVLTASDGLPRDRFGQSVAIEGDRAVVGASGVDDGATSTGALYALERVGGGWLEAGRITSTGEANLELGTSAAIAGNQVLVGPGYQGTEARLYSLGLDQVTADCPAGANSTGSAAELEADGCDSKLAGALTLRAGNLPPLEPAVLFVSQDATPLPLGNGTLCLGQPAGRVDVGGANASGELEHKLDFSAPPAAGFAPGSTWRFQLVFRDSGFGAGLDVSNALAVLLQP